MYFGLHPNCSGLPIYIKVMAQLSLLGDTQRPDFPKRASNKTKYEIISERLRLRGINHIKFEFPDRLPEKVFTIEYGNVIQEKIIDKVEWNWIRAAQDGGFRDAVNFSGKVSNECIAKLIEFFDSLPEMKDEHIYFHYRSGNTWHSLTTSEPPKYKSTSAFSYKDFKEGKVSLEIEPLIPELERRQYEAILREGNFWCGYCRKQFPLAQKVTSNIIGRGRKQVWNSWKGRMEDKACVTTTMMEFCSGTCAGNEQMSREG